MHAQKQKLYKQQKKIPVYVVYNLQNYNINKIKHKQPKMMDIKHTQK